MWATELDLAHFSHEDSEVPGGSISCLLSPVLSLRSWPPSPTPAAPQLTRLVPAGALALRELPQQHLHADVFYVLLKLLVHLGREGEACQQARPGPSCLAAFALVPTAGCHSPARSAHGCLPRSGRRSPAEPSCAAGGSPPWLGSAEPGGAGQTGRRRPQGAVR